MRYIIVDLEATCWEGERFRQMEIIEIGAVKLDKPDGGPTSSFSTFVRPLLNPTLSDFCKQLTSITQEDINTAPSFPSAFHSFCQWIGSERPMMLCSWGFYDVKQFKNDCRLYDIWTPTMFENHINLKEQFARIYNVRPCGMEKALRIAGLQLDGTHHRGIDDARNIAKLARLILPKVETVNK